MTEKNSDLNVDDTTKCVENSRFCLHSQYLEFWSTVTPIVTDTLELRTVIFWQLSWPIHFSPITLFNVRTHHLNMDSSSGPSGVLNEGAFTSHVCIRLHIIILVLQMLYSIILISIFRLGVPNQHIPLSTVFQAENSWKFSYHPTSPSKSLKSVKCLQVTN